MLKFKDIKTSCYNEAWDFQKSMQSDRIKKKIGDTVFFVEHEPVYTIGKNANNNHLLQNYPEDVKIFYIERGGDITFHGPGQLVGYPILDLHNYKMSINWYMRSLETVIINTLSKFEIFSNRKEGLTGVWVDDEKIAALGVRISRWVTMHGLAININTDLRYYDSIIPCGIFEYGITSMKNILGYSIDMSLVKEELIKQFKLIFYNQFKVVS